MSHGSIENAKTRKRITEALFTLMKKKLFSEITVTDIIKEANVARATYYRNYETKEAVIEDYMDMIKEELLPDTETSKEIIFAYDNAINGFEKVLTYFLMNKSYILVLYENGFGSMIQEIINRYMEEIAGDMPNTSTDKYRLYFIAGAAFNILIKWLKGGAMESPHEIAKACADFLNEQLLKP
jgi:Transcriptional regulator